MIALALDCLSRYAMVLLLSLALDCISGGGRRPTVFYGPILGIATFLLLKLSVENVVIALISVTLFLILVNQGVTTCGGLGSEAVFIVTLVVGMLASTWMTEFSPSLSGGQVGLENILYSKPDGLITILGVLLLLLSLAFYYTYIRSSLGRALRCLYADRLLALSLGLRELPARLAASVAASMLIGACMVFVLKSYPRVLPEPFGISLSLLVLTIVLANRARPGDGIRVFFVVTLIMLGVYVAELGAAAGAVENVVIGGLLVWGLHRDRSIVL